MIFRPKQKKPLASSPMKIDNTVSEEVEHIKFLGVNIDHILHIVDQHLAWKTHINFVCTKISKTIGMLYKAWFYVTRKSLLSLYLSLVYPYLTYHNVAWSSTYPTNINRIYLLQKRIVRTICAADHRAPGKPLIQNLAFLKFMACFHSKSDPSCLSFQNLFQTGSKIHNYYTSVVMPAKQAKKFTILYQGLKLWNSSPHSIIVSNNKRTFKCLLTCNQKT